jgi:hypothetical protein
MQLITIAPVLIPFQFSPGLAQFYSMNLNDAGAFDTNRCNCREGYDSFLILVGYNAEEKYWIALNDQGPNWANDGTHSFVIHSQDT